MLSYDSTGQVDYLDKFDAFDKAYSFAEEDAGTGLLANSQDRDLRSAFNLAGWKSKGDAQAMAVEVRVLSYSLQSQSGRAPVRMETESSSGTRHNLVPNSMDWNHGC